MSWLLPKTWQINLKCTRDVTHKMAKPEFLAYSWNSKIPFVMGVLPYVKVEFISNLKFYTNKVFFDVSLNKLLNKQRSLWYFATLWWSCDITVIDFSWCYTTLTLKQLGHFFQNRISFSNIVHSTYNIFMWNWSSIPDLKSSLWILMPWCFSTRVSVAIVLIMDLYVSSCLRD